MNCFLALATLLSIGVGIANGQQGEKGNSIIPFPRVGRSNPGQGLIPFPRIGRDSGFMKRQLIPFPRVGKRTFWHLPMESAYYTEYEDLSPMDPSAAANFLPPMSFPVEGPEESEAEKRSGNTNNASGGMWFGPRLGRKKRSADIASDTTSSEHNKDTTIDMKPLLKMLHNSNWAIIMPIKERRNFTPRLGRKRAQPFSPRLGRSGEVASSVGIDEDEEVETGSHYQRRSEHDTTPDPTLFDHSGPPFNPRLGRGGDPFNPRLGRSDPFNPRLGRGGDPFNPRLGRSGSSGQSEDRD